MRRCCAVLIALAPLLTAIPARAFHDTRQRVTDETAYTLNAGSLRAGVWKVQYGLLDFATVGTYTLPWTVVAATVQGKFGMLQIDPVALAVQVGFAYFDSSRLRLFEGSAGNAKVTALPVEMFASYRFGDAVTLSSSLVYTEIGVNGTLSLSAFDGAATGVADNLQFTVTPELRLSRVFALIVHGRWLVLQRAVGVARATYHPDAFTTVVANGNVQSADFGVRGAYSIVPSVHMSFETVNLRLGLGYGNFNIPLANIVLPRRTLIPEFDLYFVF